MHIRINAELLSGLFGIGLAAVFWFNRGTVGFLSSVFPDTVLALLALVSAILILRGLFMAEPTDLDLGGATSVGIGVVALAIWWAGIRNVGFVTTSVPVFAALALLMQRRAGPLTWRDVLIAVAVALVFVGGFFWVFSEILGIRPFRAPLI